MKTLNQILQVDELYKAKSPDEDKFVKKHVAIKHKDANGNGDDVFNASKIKTVDREKERHGHSSGKDEEVYESNVTSLKPKDPNRFFKLLTGTNEQPPAASDKGNERRAKMQARISEKYPPKVVPMKEDDNQTNGNTLNEKAPPGMEDWVIRHKKDFKDKSTLYAVAWKMYNKKEKSRK